MFTFLHFGSFLAVFSQFGLRFRWPPICETWFFSARKEWCFSTVFDSPSLGDHDQGRFIIGDHDQGRFIRQPEGIFQKFLDEKNVYKLSLLRTKYIRESVLWMKQHIDTLNNILTLSSHQPPFLSCVKFMLSPSNGNDIREYSTTLFIFVSVAARTALLHAMLVVACVSHSSTRIYRALLFR